MKEIAEKNREIIYFCLVIILIMGFLVRFSGFYRNHNLTFDEVIYSRLGLQLYNNITNYSPQKIYKEYVEEKKFTHKKGFTLGYLNQPLFKHPPLFAYLICLSCHLLGANDISPGIVSLVLGSLTILIVFFIGKIIYDWRVGLLSAFLLSVDPIHWICSEKIWIDSTLTFFTSLGILFFILGMRRQKLLVFSGLSIGLALLSKYTAALVFFAMLLAISLYQKRFWKSKWFWLFLSSPFILFFPWAMWNLAVFKNKLFEQIFIIHLSGVHSQAFLTSFLIVSSLIIIAVTLWIILRPCKDIVNLKDKIRLILIKNKFISVIIGCLGLILLISLPQLRNIIRLMLSWNNLPSYGWDVNMFSKEPWYFYLQRLLECSPVYIFSFIFLFSPFYKHRDSFFLGFSSIFILGFFIFWGDFQSRYILPVIPVLLVSSAYIQIQIYDRLKNLNGTKSGIAKFIFLILILYFILKTLRVDVGLAITNIVANF